MDTLYQAEQQVLWQVTPVLNNNEDSLLTLTRHPSIGKLSPWHLPKDESYTNELNRTVYTDIDQRIPSTCCQGGHESTDRLIPGLSETTDLKRR